MTREEIENLIKSGDNIFLMDGKKCRLFISTNGWICYYGKGMRHRGYLVNDISTLVHCPKADNTSGAYYRKRLIKVKNMLEVSGLWANIKNDITKLLEESDEVIEDMINNGSNKVFIEKGLTALGFDSFAHALKNIVSINYFSWDKDDIVNNVNNAIKNGEKYRHFWRKNYDNSIDIKHCEDGTIRGWYSTEYKNCGNGHYYLMLDATHAIYCEDD